MQKEIFSESVPKKSLPPHVQKKFPKAEFLRVQYEVDNEVEFDDDGNPMPPVNAIRPEFIKMMQESEKDYKEGRYKHFETTEELFEHLDSL
mmetsp:Transcript_15259/g.7410  ORF Transcript_15259/g.7410 Transcript_15259/m.7410 type:complete len:91 (+) Transcript_15259:39-311(+)